MAKQKKEVVFKKIIGEYEYLLSDATREAGDWVVSKQCISEQIGTSDKYMDGIYRPQDILFGLCKLDTSFDPPMLVADNIAMCGNALQKYTYKIVRTNNPMIPISWNDLLDQEEYIFEFD